MQDAYPVGPKQVPENLTAPTSAYKRRAWLAVLGLSAFVVAYVALSGWFVWTAYRSFSVAFSGGEDATLAFIAGASASFLAVFMLKALFFVRHSYEINGIEINPEQEPQLFAFLNRLADDAKAPRPHRVFLSARVNAAVFYDLSILNLILPSKKNLEIGLGLVNAVNLGEFKAVLAHEFGHFAQRSMAVGRWVYIAQQIAGHIIAARDALDRFLYRLSRFDVRIAWVGWLLSIIIWSIRSVMETLFRLVILAQRALSREMEFQADLVSVSLTGSDALIHALHRIQIADDAWERTLNFAAGEAQNAKLVTDVFAIQDRITQHLRRILGKPEYGLSPVRPQDHPEQNRIFKLELAQTPRMWATHPSNTDREANAKRTYIPADINEGSVWDLFQDAQALKEKMSRHIFKKTTGTPVPHEESLQRLDREYEYTFLRPEYRGIYLGRSVVRYAETTGDLYEKQSAGTDPLLALDSLYPESIGEYLERLSELRNELNALEALQRGVAEAPGGVLQHRGRQLRRSDLPKVIAGLRDEIDSVDQTLQAHDRRCRTVHYELAARLGSGWEEYLRGLLAVLHYADHSLANLRDVQGLLGNVFAVVTAGGRVSAKERDRLVATANRVFFVLDSIYREASTVALDRTVLEGLRYENWVKMLGEFKLVRADAKNIAKWLEVINSWVNVAAGSLVALKVAALNQLLITEADVGRFARQGIQPPEAPSPSVMPEKYDVLLPGKERELQTKLDWWGRFQIADGMVLTLVRLAVAGAIITGVLLVGGATGKSSITVYNGLDTTVDVALDSSHVTVEPFSSSQLNSTPGHHTITTTRNLQLVESFDTNVSSVGDHYVYNVAAASPLIEWTVTYGNASGKPERTLGAVRWMTTRADVLFSQPPASISTSDGKGGTRDVLSALRFPPDRIIGTVSSESGKSLIAVHARWDNLKSHYIMAWLNLAARDATTAGILQERLKESPQNPMLLRVEQDSAAAPDAHAAVCQRHAALFAAHEEADLRYVVDRCLEPHSVRDAAFLKHYRETPINPWLALAAGYTLADQGQWGEAAKALDLARQALPEAEEFVALELARVKRASEGEAVSLTAITPDSESLRDLLQLETGKDVSGPSLAFHALAQGKLDEALKLAATGSPQFRKDISFLVAGSDGASPDFVAKVLDEYKPEDANIGKTWYLFALAMKNGRDTAPYRTALAKAAPQYRTLIDGFETLVRSKPASLEDSTGDMQFSQRAYLYAAGVIALGDRAPANWRENARRLLFAPERPFFK